MLPPRPNDSVDSSSLQRILMRVRWSPSTHPPRLLSLESWGSMLGVELLTPSMTIPLELSFWPQEFLIIWLMLWFSDRAVLRFLFSSLRDSSILSLGLLVGGQLPPLPSLGLRVARSTVGRV